MCILARELGIEIDRGIHVGIGESVEFRIELLEIPRLRQAERIEIGFEMSTHPVTADESTRTHSQGCGADRRIGGNRSTLRKRGRGSLGALGRGFTVRGADDFGARTRPRRALQIGRDRAVVLREILERLSPAGVDRSGIVEKTFIKLGDERTVRAVKK